MLTGSHFAHRKPPKAVLSAQSSMVLDMGLHSYSEHFVSSNLSVSQESNGSPRMPSTRPNPTPSCMTLWRGGTAPIPPGP